MEKPKPLPTCLSRWRRLLPLALAFMPLTSAHAGTAPLVWLHEIAPEIVEEIRYAGPFNFTGAPLPGYEVARCWLTRAAAEALARADAWLAPFDLGLKVYDCYRPRQATQAMVAWSEQTTPVSEAETYFLAGLARPQAFALGYVSRQSAHNRGSTIDLTLIARQTTAWPLNAAPTSGTTCLTPPLGGDTSSLWLGSAHDCFDARSATQSAAVDPPARALRALLHTTMQRAGFRNYSKEWWHYTLVNEPFPSTRFDVPIVAGNTAP